MEIAEFVKAKRQLEVDLKLLLQGRVDRFRQETGLMADAVMIESMCTRSIDGKHGLFVIERVHVSVPLEL